MRLSRTLAPALAALAVAAAPAAAADLKSGSVELKSAGPLAFGPGGLLFVGDPQAGAVYAVLTGDAEKRAAAPVAVPRVAEALAGLLGVKADDVVINDLAVNPASNRVYLSVSRGRGPAAIPAIFRVEEGAKLAEVSLANVPNARAELKKPVADAKKRQEAITGLKFAAGKLYVAGLSNEEFASTLRVISYPFGKDATSAGVEIYHGAHGKYETASPVRTFAPVEVDGKQEILAAYTCTPLVRIRADELSDGAKVKGKTVAELGNRNRPLDIVTYSKGGKPYALLANSARGVMKVELAGLGEAQPIAAKVSGTAGLPYETVGALKGVEQLDKLGDAHAVLLVRGPSGLAVETIELP